MNYRIELIIEILLLGLEIYYIETPHGTNNSLLEMECEIEMWGEEYMERKKLRLQNENKY